MRAANSDGVWNEEGVVLDITIRPPWQPTFWFRALVLVLLALPGFFAYRWRLRSIRLRNRQLEAEVASKTHELQNEIFEHEETEARLRRTHDELMTVMALSQSMVTTVNVVELLDLILDQLKDVIDYNGVGLLTRTENAFVFRAYRGLPLGFDTEDYQIPVTGVQRLEAAIYERQPFIVDDLLSEPSVLQELSTVTEMSPNRLFGDARCWMGLPMIIGDKVIGLLGILHWKVGYYEEADLKLAQAFANQAALAIENVQLYEQAQVAAATEERNRLARDLHDSVTQTLFSISVMAETTPQVMRKNPDDGWRRKHSTM